MTVAVSISTTSLSLIISFDKAATLPPRQGRFCKHYSLLIPLPVPACWSAASITDLHWVIWWLRNHAGWLLFRSSRIYSGVRCDVLRAPVCPVAPPMKEMLEGLDRSVAETYTSTF